MHLLLTNDDGHDAPGLATLYEVCRELGRPLLVGPAEPLSGCSHRVTTDRPIRVQQHEQFRYSVQGTPADCVRIALHHLSPEPAWVLSGVNAGGNLGADVHHSGTVAAVREAAFHGLPGIALSQYRKKDLAIEWDRVAQWVDPLLRDLMYRPHQPGTFWNVNLPHLTGGEPAPEVVFCPLDPSPLPLNFTRDGDVFHYAGAYHQRTREPGADVDVCFAGNIAVTLLRAF